MKGIQYSLAKSSASWRDTYLNCSWSHLLPTKTLQTLDLEYFSISWIQLRTFSKESLSVTSYTIIMPWAPRQQLAVRVLKRSWPAVSQICSLMTQPSYLTDFNFCRVPQSHTHYVSCYGLEFTYEVDTDSVEEVFVEGVFCVPKQQTGFTDARIADQQHFEQEITVRCKIKGLRSQTY